MSARSPVLEMPPADTLRSDTDECSAGDLILETSPTVNGGSDPSVSPPTLLDARILSQHGSFCLVERWWRGAHPKLGKITEGLTGLETIECRTIVRATHVIRVIRGE